MPEASKVVVTPAHAGWRRAVGPVRTDAARDALLTDFGKATLQDRYLLAGESFQDLFARVARAVGADRADRAAPAGVRRSDDNFRSFGHLTPRLRISVTDG